eukprot:449474_1
MAQDPNQNAKKEVPQNIQDIIGKMPLTDEDENALKVRNIRYLEDIRANIYSLRNDTIKTGDHVLSVECVSADEADDIKNEDCDIFEKILVFKDNNVEEIELEDKITMDDVSISRCIEYTFYENGPWFIGEITLLSLEYYRESKFAIWKKQIIEPVCEAAFKRLLCIGLITTIFDRIVFASPDNEKKDYIVQDDHGKDVELPRPVKVLRIWDVKTRSYKPVSAHLKGAPDAKNADKYWEDMLNEFRLTRGTDYINNLLAAFKK